MKKITIFIFHHLLTILFTYSVCHDRSNWNWISIFSFFSSCYSFNPTYFLKSSKSLKQVFHPSLHPSSASPFFLLTFHTYVYLWQMLMSVFIEWSHESSDMHINRNRSVWNKKYSRKTSGDPIKLLNRRKIGICLSKFLKLCWLFFFFYLLTFIQLFLYLYIVIACLWVTYSFWNILTYTLGGY